MAVIGKIRERSGLLLVLVGGALVLFIVGALFDVRMPGRQDAIVGTVGDQEISARQFLSRVDMEVESYRNEFQQPVNQQVTDQVRNSVWNDIVKELVLLPQVEKAGFTITKAEFDDIRYGDNVIPDLRGQPNFQGADGQPDKAKLRQYFDNVQQNAPDYHEIQKRRITENRLYSKYNTLVKKSMFVNSSQAKDDQLAKNTKATFNFVAKRYDSEPDSLYAVSDDDLRRYYDQHKNDKKYKQQPSRKFEYVLFPVKASDTDRKELMAELATLHAEFRATTNDSTFVTLNSDSRSYAKVPYTEGTADKVNDSLIVHAAVGDVVGPFAENDQWKLVKVKEVVDIPEVRIRHILFSTKNDMGELLSDEDQKVKKNRADSVMAVLKRDRKKFDELNTKFTEDPGGKTNGGDYGFFGKDMSFVQEFKDAGFNNPVGWIGVVKTEFGYHLIEVMEKRTRNERRVVTVERTMKPSPATFKDVYKKANEFSLRNKTPEAFKAAAEEQGLAVVPVDELRPDMRSVPGLQQPATVIDWAKQAKVGDVSDPKDAGENYVVAALLAIREEGPPALEDVREVFTREVVKEKKAEAYIAKMQGKTDLNALATELGSTTQAASELPFSSFSLPGGYSEFEVMGRIFAMQNGTTSAPLKGDNGVYVVTMTTNTPAPEPTDVTADKATLLQRVQGRAENGVFNALREAAGVKDERSKVY